MKRLQYLSFLFMCMLFANMQAQQTKLLLAKQPVALSKSPLYGRLTEQVNGKTTYKEPFKYLDSINIFAITYLSDGLKINGLLVEPKKQGSYPAVIYNRGGNRDFGALKSIHGALQLGKVAKEGYVVIASQYRGNGGSEGQEEFGGKDVNDVIILPDVLAEVEKADTNRIGMYGWSRGGMMTYIALTKTDKIKAAIVGGAVADNFSSIKDRPRMETGVLAQLVPNYAEQKQEALEKRSAIKWADKFPKNVPILMLHGNADWRVKASQSLELALEFEKYRVPYKLVVFEGGDHGISEHKKEVDTQVLQWLDTYVKKTNTLPNMQYHGR